MSQHLPVRPHLDHLRHTAKTVLRIVRAAGCDWRLADAQRAIALGHGFSSWADLKRRVLASSSIAGASSTPRPSPSSPCGDARTRRSEFDGIWTSETQGRVILAFDVTDFAIVVTQIIANDNERPIANTLFLTDDGNEHPLPFGDDLTVIARWQDARSLQTVVRRGEANVGEGVYALANDGRTLTTSAGSHRYVFTRLIAALAVVMLAVSGCAARSDAQKRAIEALNRHDIKAALASDVDAVVSQWSDDFTQITAAGAVIRGRAANVALVTKARKQIELFEPIAYSADFEEITVSGDYAYGWGAFRTTARQKKDGVEISSSGKLLRIYQRQRDGRWLMHRTMSTIDLKTQ